MLNFEIITVLKDTNSSSFQQIVARFLENYKILMKLLNFEIIVFLDPV